MSEILTLAENFKAKSKQQVTSIEEQLQTATTQLNSFMTAKLSESESIIKDGMDSLQLSNEQLQQTLDASNKQLQQTLNKNQQDTATALTTYTETVQTLIAQDLNKLAKENQTMIQNYAQHTTQLIEQRESAIAQTLKSEVKTWAWWASGIALVILTLGVMLGALAVKKFSKPTYIIQQPQVQQPINYRQR